MNHLAYFQKMKFNKFCLRLSYLSFLLLVTASHAYNGPWYAIYASDALPYAKLSQAVYNNQTTVVDDWERSDDSPRRTVSCAATTQATLGTIGTIGMVEEFSICEMVDKFGFHASAYKNEYLHTIAVAFEGSDLTTLTDILTNLHLLKRDGDVAPAQYNMGLEFVREIKAKYPSWRIVVTGHSLGGGIAEYVASILHLPAYTFNAAGLLGTTDLEFPDESIIKSFYSTSIKTWWPQDYVSSLTGFHKGQDFEIDIPQASGLGLVGLHDTGNMILALEFLSYPPSSPSAYTAIFDGAGSLIKPSMDCWGCDKDEARMHPHYSQSQSSTVVFQWMQDSNKCSYLKIEQIPDSSYFKAQISSKHWASDSTSSVSYIATLPVTIPNSGDFTTTSVTSMSPLSSEARIKASCSTSDSDANNRQNSSAVGTIFSNDYTWMGNGSIISDDTGSCTDFGCTKDEAIASSSQPALTAFQWQVSSSCQKLRIQVKGGGSFSGRLKYKFWSHPNWEFESDVSFPQDISKSSNKDYYVFAIETEAGAIPAGKYIEARCQ